jgi:L-ascorbate metabolism protein UlaG (beta-lactamase superfamily)
MAEIRWFGHNCFRIRAREATVITDPVSKSTGYQMGRQTADIVTVSHDHPGHSNLASIKAGYKLVEGPGEYELNGVFITGIRTYHDTSSGQERGYNTIYLIELEGMIVCHLGDIGHPLESDQTELLATCDILLVPVGGGNVITQKEAADIVTLLEPKIVIPMQYATARGDRGLEGLEPFAQLLGMDIPPAEEKLTIRSSDLGETTTLVVLSPDGEPAK